MKFYGDYHTHTYFSDGFKGSVIGNVAIAQLRGFTEVAITDHSFNNPFSLTPKKFERERKQIEACRKNNPGIKIMHGIESDIISLDGDIDVPKDIVGQLDVLIMGYHRFTHTGSLANYCDIHLPLRPRMLFGVMPSKATQERHTKALIKCIQRNEIDILAHINDGMKVNVREVCRACSDYGTIVELNVKHLGKLDAVWDQVLASDVNFVVSSDAHDSKNVGNFARFERFIKRCPIDERRILNLNPTVKFRRQYK